MIEIAVQEGPKFYNSYFFKNYKEVSEWYDGIVSKHCYEIITNTWQKPYFDLEHPKPFPKWDHYVEEIIYHIKKLYGDVDIIVYESIGDKKYSQHIVVNSLKSPNAAENRKFALSVLNSIPDPGVFDIVDMGMWKRKQLFRMDQSSKFDDVRIKTRITNTKRNIIDELICNVTKCIEIEFTSDMDFTNRVNTSQKS